MAQGALNVLRHTRLGSERAVDSVENRHLSIFQHGLVHPSALDWMYLSRITQYVIKPKRDTERTDLPLCRSVEMHPHSVTNALGSESDVKHVAAVIHESVAPRPIRHRYVVRPSKLGSLVWNWAKSINLHLWAFTGLSRLRYLEH